MDNNQIPNIKSNKQAFNFLTETYEVMKCFENNPSKLGNKINELKMKFEKARTILATIPGIDMSQAEQTEYYENLLKQYKREHELLNSYKEMCKFDITQLEKDPTALSPTSESSASVTTQGAINQEPNATQTFSGSSINHSKSNDFLN